MIAAGRSFVLRSGGRRVRVTVAHYRTPAGVAVRYAAADPRTGQTLISGDTLLANQDVIQTITRRLNQ